MENISRSRTIWVASTMAALTWLLAVSDARATTLLLESLGNFPDAVEVTARFGTFAGLQINGDEISATGFHFTVRNTSFGDGAASSFEADPDGDFAENDILTAAAAAAISARQPYGLYIFGAGLPPGSGAVVSAPPGFSLNIQGGEVNFEKDPGNPDGFLFDNDAPSIPSQFTNPQTGVFDFFISTVSLNLLDNLLAEDDGMPAINIMTSMAWVETGSVQTVFSAPGAPFDGEELRPRGELIAAAVCGNGVQDPGEECDTLDDTACPGACTLNCTCAPTPMCGDGIVNQAGEICDGLDDAACPGACQADCSCPALPTCGDGSVNQAGEVCDGADDAACPGACKIDCTCPVGPFCGDGSVNQAGEVCDGADDATCPGTCQVDCTCPVGPVCGDGSVNQPAEECDGADDSACPGQCLLDCTCSIPPFCGDGSVNKAGEACDGADDAACPGACLADCTCPAGPLCGDGSVNQAGEECDGADDAACPGACQANCTCPIGPFCGDGTINQAGETCDGADDTACPGTCQADCTCPVGPFCGDGEVNQTGEECDGADADLCQNRLCLADCTCVPPIFNDPAKIRFRRGHQLLDRFDGHGQLVTSHDPAKIASGLTVRLTNPSGVLYEGELVSGDCRVKNKGRRCRFRDKGARKGEGIRDGLGVLKLRSVRIGYTFRFSAFADLSAATDPDMTISFQLGDELFATRGLWKQKKNGWNLKFFSLQQ